MYMDKCLNLRIIIIYTIACCCCIGKTVTYSLVTEPHISANLIE